MKVSQSVEVQPADALEALRREFEIQKRFREHIRELHIRLSHEMHNLQVTAVVVPPPGPTGHPQAMLPVRVVAAWEDMLRRAMEIIA